jgi:hypothetical protein
VFDSSSPLFLSVFCIVVFLAYGGWALFKPPRPRD